MLVALPISPSKLAKGPLWPRPLQLQLLPAKLLWGASLRLDVQHTTWHAEELKRKSGVLVNSQGFVCHRLQSVYIPE